MVVQLQLKGAGGSGASGLAAHCCSALTALLAER